MWKSVLGLVAVVYLWLPGNLCADQPRWIVVTAPAYRSAVKPLCDWRKAQGMDVVVVETTDVLNPKEILARDAHKLREKVNKLCGDAKTSYVLLVGAVEASGLAEPEKKVLPPLAGTTSRMKGEPSDNGYGCPGEGLAPSVAVGRFPARTEREAVSMVQKTLAYERNNRPGQWKRRFTLLAGVPLFNPIVDQMVESIAMSRFEAVDLSWTGKALYHNPSSRFCVPDDRLHDQARRYVEGGQAITLYLGHSGPQGFWGGENIRYMDCEDWTKVEIAQGPGVFATFGCYGCQLQGKEGASYGVAAMRNAKGPVAVMGSHGICFPAMVELAADGFVKSFFGSTPPERLGDCWLCMKKNLASGKLDPVTFRLLDAFDGDKSIPEKTQRLEHLEMFLFLGDPALRLPVLSLDIKLTADETACPGKCLNIKGTLPARLKGARVQVTLERAPTSLPNNLAPLPKAQGQQRDSVMSKNHDKANQFVLAKKEITVKDGEFRVGLDVPENASWKKLVIRAYAANADQEAMGTIALPVKSGR